MGEMRDSDWSRQILLRSDWLLPHRSHIDYCLLALILKRLTILSDDDEYHRYVLRRMNSIIAISDLS